MASPKERVERIMEEIEGVASQYGVTSWEKDNFLPSIAKQVVLSAKQEKVLLEIEEKVFGDDA